MASLGSEHWTPLSALLPAGPALQIRQPQFRHIGMLHALLHCTAIFTTALLYVILHCTEICPTALHCNIPYCTAMHCTALNNTFLHCTTSYWTILEFALNCDELPFTSLQYITQHFSSLHYKTQNYTSLNCMDSAAYSSQ